MSSGGFYIGPPELNPNVTREELSGPYVDPEVDFGPKNAELHKELTDKIPFIAIDIKNKFFGGYMGFVVENIFFMEII